jgi:LysM repeat protein
VRTYVVQSGDTFASIAIKERTTVARLEQLNPGVEPTTLHVGEKIRVQ